MEVNTAPLEALLRVPGIGVRGANLIVRARRTTCLREPELRKLGIAYKRARFFITCSGSYSGRGVDFSREGLRAQLAAPIKGGNHGRRADKTTPGQMSLFESVETPEKARIAGGSGARALESGDATAAASCSDAERSSNAASSSGRAASVDGTYGLAASPRNAGSRVRMSRKPAENQPLFPEEPLAEVAYCHDGSLEGLLSAVFGHTLRDRRTSPRRRPAAAARPNRARHRDERGAWPCAFGAASGGRAETPPTMPSSTPRSATTRTPAPSCTASSATPWRRTGRTIAPAASAADHAAARAGSSRIGKEPRRSVLGDLAHPAVEPLHRLARSVMNERHRMLQFLRFEHLENGVWFARCNPAASVIPLLMDWFSGRFNTQPFIIFDEAHNIAGVYEGRDWYLVQTENVDLPDRASEERLMQQAWKRFYDTVAVEARYNPELRRQFMPKRFWKNITEMQEDLPGNLHARRDHAKRHHPLSANG